MRSALAAISYLLAMAVAVPWPCAVGMLFGMTKRRRGLTPFAEGVLGFRTKAVAATDRWDCALMRHQDREGGGMLEGVVGHAAQDHFPEPAVAVGAHDEEIAADIRRRLY